MNPTAVKKIPPSIIDHTVKRQENRFAPNIIWMVDILYTVNSSDCQLEVKLSNAMYPRSIIAPEKVVSADVCFPDGSSCYQEKQKHARRE